MNGEKEVSIEERGLSRDERIVAYGGLLLATGLSLVLPTYFLHENKAELERKKQVAHQEMVEMDSMRTAPAEYLKKHFAEKTSEYTHLDSLIKTYK